MKIISELFKELQDQLIRPQMELYFEVGSDITYPVNVITQDPVLAFDKTVAPIVPPKTCINEHFYAIVGEETCVDNPNRICAPDPIEDVEEIAFPEPKTSVPYGVTDFEVYGGNYTIIGSDYNVADNFIGFMPTGAVLCFKGLIPDRVEVEVYDSDNSEWVTEQTILNPDLNEEIVFTPDANADLGAYRRFRISNSSLSGRFQLCWIKNLCVENENGNETSVIFKNNYISSVSIDQETDLTSQALPSYKMTAEVLDVDETYTPDSTYWEKLFVDGVPCLFKCGFEINGTVEYIPLFYGTLTKKPDYNEGKITFNASITWRTNWYVNEFWSLVNRDLNTGDLVKSRTFENYIWTIDLFDDYSDAFADQDDIDASVCNYYGEVNSNEVRQLVANALGCYITAGINTVDLHNANTIQYKPINDYLTRYEQIQANLESQPKVGKIVITRNEYRLSSNSDQQEAAERAYCTPAEATIISYKVPFYAIGKFIVNDYQKSVPSAAIQADYGWIDEEINEDGTVTVKLVFTVTQNTYIKPIVTFYGVDNKQFDETSYTGNDAGEEYKNDNILITNSYTADKVRRVARLVNDINNQYEIDLMQNFQYEIGDVIRIATKTGENKTCIITGLKFKFPASAGHLTCRKIFSLLDCPYAVYDPVGLTIKTIHSERGTPYDDIVTILETSENSVVIGQAYSEFTSENQYFVLGATKYHRVWNDPGYDSNISYYLTDLNGHEWGFFGFNFDGGTTIDTTATVITLPNLTEEYAQDRMKQGIISLIEAVYESQGMTAPVDDTCTWHEVT